MIKKKFLISIFLFASFFYSFIAFSQGNLALKQESLKMRKIKYRLLLSMFLQKLNQNKTIQSKKKHALFFRIYRNLLKQFYIDMKYSFLMSELKIHQKTFLNLQKNPDSQKILKLLFNVEKNLPIIQSKSKLLLKTGEDELSKYATLLELDKTDLKILIKINLK